MNLWVYPIFILITIAGIILSPFVVAYLSVTTDWETSRIFRHIVWFYGRMWIWTISPFVTIETEGFEVFEKHPGSVIVVNHLSFFDVYFMGALPHSKVGLTSRSWPRKMIWYTAFVKGAHYIDLEKSTFEQVSNWVANEHKGGYHCVFFPEGHRSRNGAMQRFHSGAFKAAMLNNITVIPFCLKGTDQLLPPTRHYLKPCKITLKALPAQLPTQFSGEQAHSKMRKTVKAAMQKEIYG